MDKSFLEDFICRITQIECHGEKMGDCSNCYTAKNLQGMAEELALQTEDEAKDMLRQWRKEIDEAQKEVRRAMQSGRVDEDERVLSRSRGNKNYNNLK